MVLSILHIPEICIWSPEQFGGVCRHVEGLAVVIFKSRIVPPLSHKYVHRVFLQTKKSAYLSFRRNDYITYFIRNKPRVYKYLSAFTW